MSLPESYYTFCEHMDAMERQHEVEKWCPYERATGDKKWSVLCGKDNKYATQTQCDKCKAQRRESNG